MCGTVMNKNILLCSDLDRTLLPNGPQPESWAARPALRALARRPELTLVYVSGRDKGLLQEAIDQYQIPVPDYAIGDVGTTIYEIKDDVWYPWDEWSREIAPDWGRHSRVDLARLFSGIEGLALQESAKQNVHKLSYYTSFTADHEGMIAQMGEILEAEGVRANFIWSVDEISHAGLLDILPQSANKLHAIEFLMSRKGFLPENTVFAGDSGNDLAVLASGIQSVLVCNASDEVRQEAVRLIRLSDHRESLYLARGGFMDMNGNYSAGVLEGLAHFIPEASKWLADAINPDEQRP